MDEQFVNICNRGDVDCAKQVHARYNISENIRNDAFEASCISHHDTINVLQWLYSLGGISDIAKHFKLCCIWNRLDAAKCLYTLDSSINIEMDVFILCCNNGHLSVAKWLHSLGTIDIRTGDDYIFINICCRYGKSNVAKWLYSLGANIHAGGDVVFKCICDYVKSYVGHYYSNYVEIFEWLLSLRQFDNNIIDAYLPKDYYEYAFSLGYKGADKMRVDYEKYEKYKNELRSRLKPILEINDIVNIIVSHV